MNAPIPYRDDVEQVEPDETEHLQRCIDSMHRTNAMTFDLYRHGLRATHAKSHGILRGHLVVHDRLPPELAQGLFAMPATYPVVVRIATETGQLDDDRKPNARGLSLKILGVEGETLHPGDPGHQVHDFLFNTLPVLPPGTAKKFMEITEIREKHFSAPDAIYGDYVAKIALYPGTAEQEALAADELTDVEHSGVLAELLDAWATDRETVLTCGCSCA